MLERPPPRFRRLISVGLSLLLLVGVSSPAWGDDATTIKLNDCGGVFNEHRRTTYVNTHCTIKGTSCNCNIQDSTPLVTEEIRTGGRCQIVEPYLQPYTDGTLHISCIMGFQLRNKSYNLCGKGTIYTAACGLQPTMSLRFKDGINPLVFGKSPNPTFVQATPNNSSVRDLTIQNHVPLVSQCPKDTATDILSFTPEIL